MIDSAWMQIVGDFAASKGMLAKDMLATLRANENYVIASRQHACGATRRVVNGLLERAWNETGQQQELR